MSGQEILVPGETLPVSVAGPQDWAGRIASAWQKSVEAIFETGRLIGAAKAALPHGAFTEMIEGQLPFGARTAQRLMAIADDARLTDPTRVSLLPASWGTLYELTRLDDAVLERRFAEGAIRPDMERRDVAASHTSPRRDNDFYPTPNSLVAEIMRRWHPGVHTVWEPCAGDGRVAVALRQAGYQVIRSDITQGQDFFAQSSFPHPDRTLCTNPPFEHVRAFIDHAFAIGTERMCLVLPERLWACRAGREQFERHRPAIWANLDWREDYLGKGGSADRALAVAIWDSPCAEACRFEVWTRQETESAERGPFEVAFSVSPPDVSAETLAALTSIVRTAAAALHATPDLNAIIRAGYARNAPIAELEHLTGLRAGAIKMRATRMKLTDPNRQRAAVRQSNKRRAKEQG